MKRIKALSVTDTPVTDSVVRKALARGAKRMATYRASASSRPIAIVKIGWYGAVERLRLDVAALKDGDRLTTNEWWTGERKNVPYRPRIVDFSPGARGGYSLTLAYVRKEHSPRLHEMGVRWGTTKLWLAADLQTASAWWYSNPRSKTWDGRARRCDVHVEHPSRTKQEFKDVRVAQVSFKEDLLKLGRHCELSGERMRAVLDAAHVVDVEYDGSDEPENGLLLRADLHRLFDGGYFWFDSDGRVKLHSKISSAYATELRNKQLSPKTLRRIAEHLQRRHGREPIA